MIHRLLLLANSRKLSGRCLAGINLKTGEWIRPVSSDHHGTIPNAWCTPGGRPLQPLDVIEVDLHKPAPQPHQPENWLLGASSIIHHSTLTLEEAAATLLPQINRRSVLTATERALKAASVREEPVNASLSLFGVNDARVGVNRDGKLRVWFTFLDEPWELSFTGITSPEIQGEHASALICVSLAEEWREEHWKLAASLIPVPSVTAFKFAAKRPAIGPLEYLIRREFGTSASVPTSGRLSEGNWFHQCRVSNRYFPCGHETLEVFRRHYFSRRLGVDGNYHYFALYCKACNRLESTSPDRAEANAKLRKETNAIRAVTAACPECEL